MPNDRASSTSKLLSDYQQQFNALFDHTDLTIFELDIASDQLKLLAGHAPVLTQFPERCLTELLELVHSEPDRKLHKEAQERPGTPVIVAARLPGPPPETRWSRFIYSPVFEKDGRQIQLMYRLGVDDLMQARESLEEALRFAEIETFEEDAETGEGHFLFGFGDKTGTGFVGGDKRLERIPPVYRERVRTALDQIGQKVEFPFLQVDSPELKWWEQQTIREYTNEDGRRILVGMARSIHAEKSAVLALEETVKELKVANEAALAATKAKSEFLANMSHEIRTPLHAILGLSQLIGKSKDLNAAKELGQKIVTAGASLQQIINDILDFSKIDAGKLKLDEAPFSLQAMLDNLAVIMNNAAAQKELSLAIRVSTPPTHYFIGDRLRIEQVLINLLGNAIKFTEQGGVILGVSLELAESGRVKLSFSVEDTGIGLSKEARERVFNAFEQADTSTTRNFGGTGLGLTISSRLLALMDSILILESEKGVGSTFKFEIELEQGEPLPRREHQLQNLRVLVADDQETALEALATTAEGLGWSAERFNDGTGLVSAVRRDFDAGQMPDLILVDFDMPDMNGLESARQIKRYLGDSAGPIVVMVSALGHDFVSAMPGSDEVDAILEKPITTSDLFDTLMNIQGAQPIAKSDSAKPLDGVRLLVVDDNEFNREVANAVFSEEGAKVICLEDGEQAVRWLKLNHSFVDLVLMDIQMPILDGLAATRQIRTELGLSLPILALSAAVFDKDRAAAAAVGMNGFIGKPFDIDSAIEEITTLVKMPAERQSGSEVAVSKKSLSDFDESAALRYWGSRERMEPYLAKFISEYADVSNQFSQLSRKEAEVLAHKVKGTAAVLGMQRLAEHSRRLMVVYAEQLSEAECGAEISRFDRVLADTLTQVRGYLGGNSTTFQ